MQEQPELVGFPAVARGAVGLGVEPVLLDHVFNPDAGAIELLVERLGLAAQVGDDKTDVGALRGRLDDAGYRGHNAPGVYKPRVFTAGQKRRVTPAIKRQMKRRSAVEPVIGHIKNGHRMDRNRLAHKQGDAINPILAAAGYNFRLILKWIRILLTLRGIWLSEINQTRSVQIAA